MKVEANYHTRVVASSRSAVTIERIHVDELGGVVEADAADCARRVLAPVAGWIVRPDGASYSGLIDIWIQAFD